MADGFRSLENSTDVRITEQGIPRATEQFKEGASSLSSIATIVTDYKFTDTNGAFSLTGIGSGSFDESLIQYTETSLSASGSITLIADVVNTSFANLTSTSSVNASALQTNVGSSSITGTGTLSVSPSVIAEGMSILFATASTVKVGERIRWGYANLNGVGTMSTTDTFTLGTTVDLSSIGTISADPTTNSIVRSSMTAVGTKTITGRHTGFRSVNLSATGTITAKPFISDLYINVENVWKEARPFVKYQGNWVRPRDTYKKISGTWTKVY